MIAPTLDALSNPRYENDGIKRKYKSRDASDEHPPPDTLSAEGSPNRSADRPDENRAKRVEDGDAPHISVPNAAARLPPPGTQNERKKDTQLRPKRGAESAGGG